MRQATFCSIAISPLATTDPPPVRRVRRASRPLRLWRHLRARPSDSRRAAASASDVLALVQASSAPTIMRYPGGNFVSGYNWEDGVGPVEKRPRAARPRLVLDRAEHVRHQRIHRLVPGRRASSRCWRSTSARAAPTRRATSSNTAIIPAGTALSDLRRAHGWEEPHGVKFWCLGNEMDGPWQMEHKTADRVRPRRRRGGQDDALDRSHDRTRRLRLVRPQHADLRALGGRGARAHLRPCRVHLAAHLSQQLRRRHRGLPGQPRPDGQLHRRGRGDRRRGRGAAALAQAHHAELRRVERLVPHPPQAAQDRVKPGWPVAPPILEEVYTMEDALAFGGACISLLNHADRVKAACLAQLVNAIAPIMTETGGPAWRQTIFLPSRR